MMQNRKVRIFLLPFCCAALVHAQAPAELIAKIRAHMKETIEGVPNYTCQQLVERYRAEAGKKLTRSDALRLDVAVVARRELFAWPGESNFRDINEHEAARRGTFGTGNFSSNLSNALNGTGVSYQVQGEEMLDKRNTIRVSYEIPARRKPYAIKIDQQQAITGVKGQFWVDRANLDVLKLEFVVTEIPDGFPLKDAGESIEYERIRIGTGDFLLPKKASLNLQMDDDLIKVNRTTFSSCRQYSGDSVIRFEGLVDEAEAAKGPEEVKIPPGTLITIELRTAVDSGKSAIGDPVEGVVYRAVKAKGDVLLPKGAIVEGRITKIQKLETSQQGFFSIIGLEFQKASLGSRFAQLSTGIEDGGSIAMTALAGQRSSSRTFRLYVYHEKVAKGEKERPTMIYSSSGKVELSKGSLLVLRVY